MHQPQMLWTREPEQAPQDETGMIAAEVLGKRPDHLVCIYDHAIEDRAATEESGRPRFKNHPFIAVRAVDTPDFASRPIRPEDYHRFPRAAANYEKRKAAGLSHALELLPGIGPAQILELEALKLYTMELLAASDDEIGDLEPFRAAARRFLKPRFRVVEGQMVAA